MNGRHPSGDGPALGPDDAARLAQAFGLLQQGRIAEAAAIASEMAMRVPASGEPLHMIALCRKARGDLAGAAETFETARARAPNDVNLLGNYANLLRQLGRPTEAVRLYRRALELAPANGAGWMNLGLALRDAGDPGGACAALERAVQLRPSSSAAWQALGSGKRAAGDLEGAETALRRAVALEPRNGGAWTNLGVVRRLLGDPADSLECYVAARRAGFNGPEIDDAEASALLDLGEPARALEGARRLATSAPTYVPGHAMLANILWEHGDALAPGEDPAAAFRAAVAAQPANRALRLEFVRFLLEADAAAEALAQIRALRALDNQAAYLAMEANALEMLDERDAAGGLFRQAYPALRTDAAFLNLFVRHLLRGGEPELAAARALEALDSEPSNQLALALLGLAWRLTGDPREDWLCGYDRLVTEVTVEPPPGFADETAFLAALETTLTGLHTARREPVNQSLRGGSQTSGVLFGRRDPVIRALRDAIADAVARHAARLPEDPAHPFLRRRTAGVRFAGSWSVRLRSSGRHVNHFHQQGWISSAFYVSLPPSVAAAREGDTAGCIQFGEPPAELGLELGPRRIIRPTAGRLVLFPSYVWHGTVPFEDDAPRITVAFDAVPTRREGSA
jgi:tetratricopeptide (TPR) repeat protein